MRGFCDMFLVEIISIALALSIDTFAVSATGGCTNCKINLKTKLIAASVFALCQTSLTVIGWAIGENAYNLIENLVRVFAFVLLTGIGLKMCFDAIKNKEEDVENFLCPLKLKLLFVLGLATSIDALAVGVSFAFTNVNIVLACVAIAPITAFASLLGIYLGKAAVKISRRLPLFGGIVLITIAICAIFEI